MTHRQKKLALIAGLVVLTLLLSLAVAYQRIQHYAQSPLLLKQDVIFTLPAGTGRSTLEKLLVEQKVMKAGRQFQWLLRIRPELSHFKAGTYRLTPDMNVEQLLLLLKSGKEAQFSIRFIEGSRLQEWLVTLQKAPYLKHQLQDKTAAQIAALVHKDAPSSLEGWLYPDTYLYTAGTSDLILLQRAYQRMQKEVSTQWQNRQAALPYKNSQEMLIMASIIEKETGVASERTQVASVFINRLRKGMRLQTDPTVIYGMGEAYQGNITRQDLQTPTPYNTYVIDGLPPTPIAMPGLASIEAAAHPAQTDYLYFVADGQGGHVFSQNLQAHNQAVSEYLKVLRQKK